MTWHSLSDSVDVRDQLNITTLILTSYSITLLSTVLEHSNTTTSPLTLQVDMLKKWTHIQYHMYTTEVNLGIATDNAKILEHYLLVYVLRLQTGGVSDATNSLPWFRVWDLELY